jgi:bacillithiol disulfide reductase
MKSYDAIVIGAGPTGLAAALEARKLGLEYLVLDKGCVTNSIFHFPTHMVFFTTPELLEIGNLPMVCEREKPTRLEALKYYRRVVQTSGVNVHQYEQVERLSHHAGQFEVRTTAACYSARNVVIATGYYDSPNMLGIPGEDLPHVSHYYTEAHPYFERDVVVIGGQNSAAEAALELFRSGARVTLVHRRETLGHSLKYWVRPDIENRIERGEIPAYMPAEAVRITETHVRIRHGNAEIDLPAHQVFALTGYQPTTTFFDQLGVRYDPEILVPDYDAETYETNVPGVFLAGSIVAGKRHKEIFIENGRFHGQAAMRAIAARRGKPDRQEGSPA